jgi:hypothetical protein
MADYATENALSRDKTLTAEEKAEHKANAAALSEQAAALFTYQGNTMNQNLIAAGNLFMNNFGSSNNAMVKAFARIDGTLCAADKNASIFNMNFKSNAEAKPAVGDEIEVVIRKQNDVYSLQFGDEDPVVVDNVPLGNDEGKIYVGFYAARAAEITVSDYSLEKTAEVTSLEIQKNPDKTVYIAGQSTSLDTDGMRVVAKYADGTSKTISDDDYICGTVDLDEVGTKTVTVNYGGKTATYDIEVDYNRVTDMTLTYAPFTNSYLVGQKFSTVGMEINATYKSGESEKLSDDQYVVSIDGKEMGDDNYYFSTSDIGKHTVTVAYKETESILADGKQVSYSIEVKPATMDSIEVRKIPVKGTTSDPFDLNEDFDTAGLIISAVFTSNGESVSQVLDEDDYTLSGYGSTTEGVKTITVTLNNDPTKTCTFKVNVVAKRPVQAIVMTYPRQTFYVGEKYDDTGLTVGVRYDNGVTLPVEDTGYEWKVDSSEFDSSKAGNSFNINVVVDIDGEKSTVAIPTVIAANENKVWKVGLFGASSLGAATGDPSSNVTVYNNDGTSTFVSGDTVEAVDENSVGIMENGVMTNVDKVNVTSWGGAGKYATDHDGIAYYYTRVDADNNFTVSADVTVNRYIRDPEDSSTKSEIAKKIALMQPIYDANNMGTIDDDLGLDMIRSGQEAFGIMARDVVPLYLPTEDGGDDNSITTDFNRAVKGSGLTASEPMNIFEAYMSGKATKEDVNAISFSSNVIVAGGATSSTFPTDPTVSSFKTKAVQNRITLSYRSGVIATDGTGSNTKGGFKTTTDSLPKKGSKYNITLKKINYGYSLTTYDYSTGETQTVYCFDTSDDIENLLTTQDEDNIYVGFFACRYADIDVENIQLYETNASVDKVVNSVEETTYSPKISVESKLYTNKTNYSLLLKSSNPSGGLVTIKQGDEVIYSDVSVTKKATAFPTTLPEGSQTEFTIIYTPSKSDLCYSYDKVVSRIVVTQKALDGDSDIIYVAPDGKVGNEGTRENPLDLETALGILKEGQKIVMLDGVYTTRDTLTIAKSASGYADAKKYIVADEGATPVIDLQDKYAGFIVSADYWEFDGITICNSAGNNKPFHIGGQHIVVKNCTFRDNGDAGFQISRTDSSDNMEDWPSDILVENCEAYNNCDPSKNNADGFACKLTVGNNILFKGCISHHNLDDGWDLYTKLSTGKIGAVTLENCVSYRQGYELYDDGSEVSFKSTSGNNGFKMGGEAIYVMHYLKDCRSFGNFGNGVDTNTNPALKIRNLVSYNNGLANFALYSTKRSAYDYNVKGAVSYRDSDCEDRNGTGADRIGSLTEYTAFANNSSVPLESESNYFIYDDAYADSVNSAKTAVTPEFFKSLNMYDSLTSEMKYPRDDDGAFILGDFLTRTTPYTHAAEDLVTLPDTGNDSAEATTSKPSDSATEATTAATSSSSHTSSGGGGGGGGGSSSSLSSATTTTTEADTEATTADTDENTEVTTATAVADSNLFDDIDSKPWAADAINALAKAGIINGVGDGKFAPDANCKRADFVIILANVLGLDGTATDNFDDVAASKYYYNAVGLAKEAGVVNGYGDGNFGPENSCTRAELMVMVANALSVAGVDITADTTVLDKFADKADIPTWAVPYVAYLVENGIVNGSNGLINPNANITRAEVAVIMYNVYGGLTEASEESVEETVEEVEEVTEDEAVEAETEETEATTEEVAEA